MEIDREEVGDDTSAVSKARFFVILGIVVLLFSGASYYFLRGPSPFARLKEVSTVELPAGSKAVSWIADDDREAGLFQIPKAEAPAFIERYAMKPDKIFAYSYSARRCSKDGKEEILTVNNDTGMVDLALWDRPCRK